MHTTTTSSFPRAGAFSLCVLTACSIACNRSAPTPTKDSPQSLGTPESSATAPAIPTASAGTAAADSPKSIPTLTLEKFAPAGSEPRALYAIDGALVVVDDQRVGRIVDDGIEWSTGKIPPDGAYGRHSITSVHGRWPDAVDVLLMGLGRAPEPKYFPLTGKGVQHREGDGGALGHINGVATVGESTVVAGFTAYSVGHRIVTVRGPGLVVKQITPAQAGCKAGEISEIPNTPAPPAIVPRAFGATSSGTLVSIGRLCEKRGVAAEVWDNPGKSRIVDLSGWGKGMGDSPTLLKGTGDELWLFFGGGHPILHYRSGNFEPIPVPEKPIKNVFVSAKGELHASDGGTIHRYGDGKWIPIAHLTWPTTFRALAIDDKGALWGDTSVAVYKFVEGHSVAFHDGCTTPFVYLYDISSSNAKDFTFPSTRKALSTFPGVSEIGLVEFRAEEQRRLGITVASKESGEAVLAHVKANMKDEQPRLLCYEPKEPRKVELKAKGK
jgi:hypothetical protein